MNAPFPIRDAQPRHKFTVEDVLKMTAEGLVPKRAVLLDGEIYDMPEDGFQHISHAMALAQHIMVLLFGKPYFVGVQTTLRLSKHNGPSPDIYVLDGALTEGDVAGGRILLVIEVADTSLKDDLADSAARYARHGVRDFWVVDVNARRVHVLRDPHEGAYRARDVFEADQDVHALLIPDLVIRLESAAPAARGTEHDRS